MVAAGGSTKRSAPCPLVLFLQGNALRLLLADGGCFRASSCITQARHEGEAAEDHIRSEPSKEGSADGPTRPAPGSTACRSDSPPCRGRSQSLSGLCQGCFFAPVFWLHGEEALWYDPAPEKAELEQVPCAGRRGSCTQVPIECVRRARLPGRHSRAARSPSPVSGAGAGLSLEA